MKLIDLETRMSSEGTLKAKFSTCFVELSGFLVLMKIVSKQESKSRLLEYLPIKPKDGETRNFNLIKSPSFGNNLSHANIDNAKEKLSTDLNKLNNTVHNESPDANLLNQEL